MSHGDIRNMIVAAAVWIGLSAASAVAQCTPDGHPPPSDPGTGCEWWYNTASVSSRTLITARIDEPRHSVWEDLPPCACGWYPHTVPCPSCPPSPITKTIKDTLKWSTSSSVSSELALALKERLLSEIGFIWTLTVTEQSELIGSHTESTSITLNRQPIMCFTRHYRQVWSYHYVAGETYNDWVYFWDALDPDLNLCAAGHTTTTCTEQVARGSAAWNTFPNYEWAPQQPPCGGVPIQNPDPWDGERETPCCETVCVSPPPGEHPCCGCEAAP
jgi:hypothetical protein